MKIKDLLIEADSTDPMSYMGGIGTASPHRGSPIMSPDLGGGMGPGGAGRGSAAAPRGKTPATAILRGKETPAQARAREAGEKSFLTPQAGSKKRYTRDEDLPIIGQTKPKVATTSPAPTTSKVPGFVSGVKQGAGRAVGGLGILGGAVVGADYAAHKKYGDTGEPYSLGTGVKDVGKAAVDWAYTPADDTNEPLQVTPQVKPDQPSQVATEIPAEEPKVRQTVQDYLPGMNENLTEADPESDFLKSVIGPESGNRPGIKNPKSSAKGLYQITKSTWENLQKRADPRSQLARTSWDNMQNNVAAQHEAGRLLASDYTSTIKNQKLPSNKTAYYMLHNFGPASGAKILKNPNAKLGDIIPPEVYSKRLGKMIPNPVYTANAREFNPNTSAKDLIARRASSIGDDPKQVLASITKDKLPPVAVAQPQKEKPVDQKVPPVARVEPVKIKQPTLTKTATDVLAALTGSSAAKAGELPKDKVVKELPPSKEEPPVDPNQAKYDASNRIQAAQMAKLKDLEKEKSTDVAVKPEPKAELVNIEEHADALQQILKLAGKK